MVTVEIDAGGKTGFGFTYVHKAAAGLIADKLAAPSRAATPFRSGSAGTR